MECSPCSLRNAQASAAGRTDRSRNHEVKLEHGTREKTSIIAQRNQQLSVS